MAQLVWVSSACIGMFLEFGDKVFHLFIGLCIRLLQLEKFTYCFLGKLYFKHSSVRFRKSVRLSFSCIL